MTTSKEVLPETITDEMVQDGFSQPLSQEIAKRYNGYSQLRDSNRELVEAISNYLYLKDSRNASNEALLYNLQRAINNAKNLLP